MSQNETTDEIEDDERWSKAFFRMGYRDARMKMRMPQNTFTVRDWEDYDNGWNAWERKSE